MIDLADAFQNAINAGEDPHRPGDPIHPNERGHKLIAEALVDAALKSLSTAARDRK